MKTFLLLALLVTFGSLGEILSAKGMRQVGDVSFRPREILRAVARAARNKYLFLSVFFLALSFFTFLSLLSYADLSYVVPLTAVGYITNTVGAKFLLKEKISRGRWAGTLLVAAGVAIISLPSGVEAAAIKLASHLAHALSITVNPSGRSLSAALPLGDWLTISLRLTLLALVIASIAYYALALAGAWSWARDRHRQRALDAALAPPVSVLIPVRGADAESYETFAGFCRQDYPEYQIIFGVRDADDPAVEVIRKLQADFPGRHIELVISPLEVGHNAKVSNLQNMSARLAHDYLVIADSDIRVGADYLRRVIAPLQREGVGMVTCLYRGTLARTFAARLENVGLAATFAPEVLSSRLLEGVRFALGSTIAVRRALLEQIGGFRAIADYLADDFLLGNRAAATGCEVVLSECVVEHVAGRETVWTMLTHQLRWNRAVRASRPKSYVGLVVTYGTTTSLLLAAALGFAALAWWLAGLTYALRLTVAWAVGVVLLSDRGLRRDFWLIPLRDWIGFAAWAACFFGDRVRWRGNTFRVLRGGKITPTGEA
jgi:ceramide glucosyltransferase